MYMTGYSSEDRNFTVGSSHSSSINIFMWVWLWVRIITIIESQATIVNFIDCLWARRGGEGMMGLAPCTPN